MRRHALLAALAGVVLGACVPAGNTDPEVFRPEYEAVREAMGGRVPVKLHDMAFAVVSPAELEDWCDNPGCVATTIGTTIVLPYFGAQRCERAAPMSDEIEAVIVIHEMFHALGQRHGPAHDANILRAWQHYQLAGHCDPAQRQETEDKP